MKAGFSISVFFLSTTLAAAPATEALLRAAASSYREGRSLDALSIAAEALTVEPENPVAKNYIWVITRDLQKKRPRLARGEKEKDGALAMQFLADRRRRTEKALAELSQTSRRTGDFRSPTGLLTALGGLGQSLGADLASDAAGAQGQVYMDNILGNLQAALEKNVFVTRKDHMRAEGYLAYYRKDWPRAVGLWEKALREDPDDAQIKNDLSSLKTMLAREKERDGLRDLVAQAMTHQETGSYAQAVEAWREVLRRDPKHPGAVESLAASKVALEKTLQLKKLDAMNEEAAAFYRDGRHMKAAEIWLEALQLDPTYQKARVWLKLVGNKLERSDEPEEPAPAPVEKVAPAAPSAALPGDNLMAEQLYKKGLVSYAGGHLEEANQLWRKALAADPSLKKAQEALKQGESELSLTRR